MPEPSSPYPQTANGPAYQIFLYAAPVILAFSVSICCLRLFLTYILRSHRRRHNNSLPMNFDFDTEQPSTLSLAFSRSPFFELFRHAPPPPSYDDSAKHMQQQQNVQNENNNENVLLEAPPIDSNAPPGYTETRANPV
uniref:Uncharacterized protein n=1 Tax=Panagrolaimus sp. ES5 TaxID=591445 RepID=A0AC34GVM3_9BILA